MNVMLSYKSDDIKKVETILARLAEHNIKPWIDTERIEPASPWRDVLLEELRTCQVCIPVLSKAYVASEHCRMEVFIARSFNRRIVPVMLERCFDELRVHEETRGLEDVFMILHYNLTAVGLPIDETEAFRRLAEGILNSDASPRSSRPVYVSYAAEAAVATDLAKRLETLGVGTWVATLDCRAGENWRNAQARAMLRACAHVVVLDATVTEQAVLRTEMLLAEARDLPVFTVYSRSLVNAPDARNAMLARLEKGHQTYRRLTAKRGFYLNDDIETIATGLAKVLRPFQQRE